MLEAIVVLGMVVVYLIPTIALQRSGGKTEEHEDHPRFADRGSLEYKGFAPGVRLNYFASTLGRHKSTRTSNVIDS